MSISKSISLLVAISILTGSIPARAAGMDDLVQLDKDYSANYFDYLNFKRISLDTLQRLDKELAELRGKLDQANARFNEQNSQYSAFVTERGQAPIRIENLNNTISDATKRDQDARSNAVSKGFFQGGESIDSSTIASHISERNQSIGKIQGEIDGLNADIRRVKSSSDFVRISSDRSVARDAALRAEEDVRTLASRRAQLLNAIENEQARINTLMAEINALDSRRSDLEINIIPRMQENLNRMSANVQEIDAKIAQLDNFIARKRPEIENMVARLNEASQSRDRLNGEVRGLQQNLGQIDQNLAKMPELRKRAQEIQAKLPELNRELGGKQAEANQLNQNIQGAQARVNQVAGEVSAAQNEVNQAQGKKNQAASRLSQLQNELQNLNNSLGQLPALRTRRDQLAGSQIPQAQNQLQNAQTQVQQAQQALSSAQSALSQEEGKQQGIVNQIKALQEQIQRDQAQINQLNHRLQELQRSLEQGNAGAERLARLQAEKTQTQNNLNAANSQLASAQANVQQKKAKLDELMQKYKITDPNRPVGPGAAEIQAANREFMEAQRALQGAQNNVKGLSERLGHIDEEMARLQNGPNRDQIQAEMRQVQGQIAQLESDKNQKSQALAALQGQLNGGDYARAKAAVAQAEGNLRTAQAQVNDANTRLANLNKELAQVDGQINGMGRFEQRRQELQSREIPGAQNEVNMADQSLSRAAANLAAKNNALSEAQIRLNQANGQLAAVNARIQELQRQNNEFQAKLNELNNTLSQEPQLQQRRAEAAAQLQVKTNELNQVNQRHQELTQRYERERREFEGLVHEREELARRHNEIAERFQREQRELNERLQELTDDRNGIAQRRDEISRSQVAREDFSRDLSETNQRLSDAESLLPSARAKLAAAEEAFDSYYAANIEPIARNVAQHSAQKSSLESERFELGQLDSELKRLAKNISDARSELATIQARIPVLDGEIARLDPIVRNLKSAVDIAQGSVNTKSGERETLVRQGREKLATVRNQENQIDEIIKKLSDQRMN